MSDSPDLSPEELASFDELRTFANTVTPADSHLESPPAAVWDAIDADLPDDNVLRGPWRLAGPALVAAAAVIVLVFGGIALTSSDDLPDPLVEVALKHGDGPGFDALGVESTGHAGWVEDDEVRCLEIEVDRLPSIDGAAFSVWLVDVNVEEMVWVGNVDGDTCIDVPASVDPAALPVVDISIEPDDGNRAHSGRSILRGQLEL